MPVTDALQVELLPRAAYCARDTADDCVLGIALEPQRGVHAIGSDRRMDFQSRFGEMSFKPAGMPVSSESDQGGEYLLVRSRSSASGLLDQRPQWLADRRTLAFALQLRAGLAGGKGWDELSELVQRFVCHAWAARGRAPQAQEKLRALYAPVVQWIEHALDDGRNHALRLEVLAAMAGQSVFQFLRGFSEAFALTPHAFVAERRLQRARGGASRAGASLADVAAASGYASQSHMGASFRRALGLTPAQWRRRAAVARIVHSD